MYCFEHANHDISLNNLIENLGKLRTNSYIRISNIFHVEVTFSANKVSLKLSQSSVYSYGWTPFRKDKTNLLISWLGNLYVLTDFFFRFSWNFFLISFVTTQHLYSIKLSLKFICPRQHSQYFYFIPQVFHFLSWYPYSYLIIWIRTVRLLTRFNKFAINLALLIKCYM